MARIQPAPFLETDQYIFRSGEYEVHFDESGRFVYPEPQRSRLAELERRIDDAMRHPSYLLKVTL